MLASILPPIICKIQPKFINSKDQTKYMEGLDQNPLQENVNLYRDSPATKITGKNMREKKERGHFPIKKTVY